MGGILKIGENNFKKQGKYILKIRKIIFKNRDKF